MSELRGKKLQVVGGRTRYRGKIHKKRVGNVLIVERKINIIPKIVSFLLVWCACLCLKYVFFFYSPCKSPLQIVFYFCSP